MLDYKEIEAKWQKAWEEAKIFEAEPSGKQSRMVFAAFPYVNTPLHIGHLRTYGTVDLLARYDRMRGYNVLFPMAFHATGTPVLAFAKRIGSGDKEIVEELKMFHISDEDIAKMTDPEFIANYFINEARKGYGRMGLSLDTRRQFISTEPFFSKFVEWQFSILNSKGLLVQGRHPVGWCTNENNAVGMHDTQHGLEPEIEVQTAIRFKVDGEEAYMFCSTYRPETLPGVTNLFIKEGAVYVLCNINDRKEGYYIAKASAERLKYQMSIRVLKEIDSKEMLAKRCTNPLADGKLPVLPGFFVKEEIGTGVVMSVPAHAPFDYAALERLRQSGYPMHEIKPKKVLDVEIGRSLSDVSAGEARPTQLDIPALAYLEILHTKSDAIDDMLEFATKLEYREESHWGKMIIKGYEGMSEPEAREKMQKELLERGDAIQIYALQNEPVYCRCGTRVLVKVVDNQWFLNYGDERWKAQAREALKKIKLLPNKSRSAFEYALEWINLRAVARAQGLGTKFPLDKNYIIESLSDSTIYPAFYTISNIIRDVDAERLKPEFFDCVFLGKGDASAVAKSTGIDYEKIKRSKESFEYWYTNTSNHSAPELIPNHFTMYIFNHVAIFDRKYWPKQIVSNGMVLSEGEKMSKSLGNIVPLIEGVEKYGADTLRIDLIAGTDLYTDVDFSVEAVKGISERLSYLHDAMLKLTALDSGELKQIDYWLYSKLNRKIESTTQAMEMLELRDAYTGVLYDSVLELRRYFARGGNNAIVVKDYLTDVVLMLQPVAPHISEEMWHALGNTTFASTEKWPTANKEMLNGAVEAGEQLVDNTIEDAKQVIALMQKKSGKKAKELRVIVASDWKAKLVNALAKEKKVDRALEKLKDDASVDKEAAAKLAGMLAKKINEIQEVNTAQKEELESLREASDYIAKQLGCAVVVESEEESKSQRAGRAMPTKPSLDITLG